MARIQLTLCKMDTFWTGTECPFWRDVRVIESQLKGANLAAINSRCPSNSELTKRSKERQGLTHLIESQIKVVKNDRPTLGFHLTGVHLIEVSIKRKSTVICFSKSKQFVSENDFSYIHVVVTE